VSNEQQRGKFAVVTSVLLASFLLCQGVPAKAAGAICPTIDLSTGAPSIAPAPGINWSGCSLRGMKIDGADLSGANLSGADLRPIHISGTDFYGTHVLNTNLSTANLQNANLTGSYIAFSNLTSVNVSGASLGLFSDGSGYGASGQISDCDVTAVNFSTANLDSLDAHALTGSLAPGKYRIINRQLYGPYVDLRATPWNPSTSPDLKSDLVAGLDLTGAYFGSADLSGAILTGINFTQANFYKANLSGVKAQNVNFTRAGFTETNLTGAQLQGANLTTTSFTRAIVDDANFYRAKFSPFYVPGTDWSAAVCPDGDLGAKHASRSCLKKLLKNSSATYPKSMALGKSYTIPASAVGGGALTATMTGKGCSVSKLYKTKGGKRAVTGLVLKSGSAPTVCKLSLSSPETSTHLPFAISKRYYVGWSVSPVVEDTLTAIQGMWPVFNPQTLSQRCEVRRAAIASHKYIYNNGYKFVESYREGLMGTTPLEINARITELTLYASLC
jgi:uncharacterized protein YjbI with pentapeptide repeats